MVTPTMPELPEVEVTRRKLAPVLIGRTIDRVVTTAPSYFFLTPPDLLARKLKGATVEALGRHGKYLVAELRGGDRLLLHLGMTGQLFAEGSASVQLLRHTATGTLSPRAQRQDFAPDEHTHLWFQLRGPGGDVFFRDARKFGKVQWLPRGGKCERLEKLGVDALSADGAALFAATRRRKGPVKSVLLDQSVLSGVGNIYADEALHRAKISPLRVASRLARRDCDSLVSEVQAVMLRSIETGGSSISDYIQPDGERGTFQDERRVYGLSGKPCPVCGVVIARVVLGGRSSHYCPRCQGR